MTWLPTVVEELRCYDTASNTLNSMSVTHWSTTNSGDDSKVSQIPAQQ